MKRTLKVGEEVMLQMGIESERCGVHGLLRRDGYRYKISRIKTIDGRSGWTYYELKGCNSPHGIPYSILEEWLLPTE